MCSPVCCGYPLVYFDLEATGMEVLQIGAYFAGRRFSKYVCPRGDVAPQVTSLTGLSKIGGRLYRHGQPVPTVSKLSAWQDFLNFLQSANNKVVLVMYGADFDYKLLSSDLPELGLMNEFRRICAGTVDAQTLCKSVFPSRSSYKLENLVKDILGIQRASKSHDALEDAINVAMLMERGNVQSETFQNFSKVLPN